MEGVVKRNISPPTGRRDKKLSWQPAPVSVETNCGSCVAEISINRHNVVEFRETEKRNGVVCCRPWFYLSLEGYRFSRSCEGG